MAKKAKKKGRPTKPASQRRTSILKVCLTKAELGTIREASGQLGLEPSVWARAVLLSESPETPKTNSRDSQ